MPSEWVKFDCAGSSRRWRYLEDGRVEIEGEGTPAWPSWPDGVNQRRSLIQSSADKYGVPEEYIAAIMALETRGNNVCRTRSGGICYGPGPCNCISGEGCGLMAVMGSTASNILGRGVTCAQLMADEQLAVDAGAAYLKYQLDDLEYQQYVDTVKEWQQLQLERMQLHRQKLAERIEAETAMLAARYRELERSLKLQHKRLALLTAAAV